MWRGQHDFVPESEIIVRQGGPSPPLGSRNRGISKADRRWAKDIIKRYKPRGPTDIAHMEPLVRTPPGKPQKFRLQRRWRNQLESPQIRHQAAEDRLHPESQNPESPHYVRPKNNAAAPPETVKPSAPAQEVPEIPRPPEALPRPPAGPEPPRAAVPPKSPIPPGLIPAVELLSVVGDVLFVKAIAEEGEWLLHPEDPKWGTVHVDMYGNVWEKHGTQWWNTNAPMA